MCHVNKNFDQTAGQVAHKSYPFGAVRATDIAIEGQVTKNVASSVQNELVIGLEDRLLLTCCIYVSCSVLSW